ncbi:DUF1801 domain-containing protein [Comamonas sp. w2-DMI]|uniref:DUF1801 domain-containing protein n=1 Tax=Comamonas sp. w2-DMI TaxID=3126391 RepID=UPI0032E36FEE
MAADKSVEAGASGSEEVERRIAALGGWRAVALQRMRALIKEVEPGVVEECKWRGTPVWSCEGMLCTGESYRDKVKLTFQRGAALADPHRLFNASLEGNMRRAIDIFEGQPVDEQAFRALVREAIDLNRSLKRAKAARPGR